jgi:uncharacterized lipoprotein YddW (UPF0748 family)
MFYLVKNMAVKLKGFVYLILLPFTFCLLPSLSFGQTKAVWIRPFMRANVEIRGDETKSREFIKNELTKIKRAKINTIFVESLWDGYTIYPSKITAQRPLSIEYGTARTNAKNFDVLQIYLDEAAKLDLKVHAWLHIFHQWNTNLGDLKNSPIFAKHADWAALDQNNSPSVVSEAEGKNRDIYKVFLSPSNAEARQLLQNIVRELAEKYPRLSGAQWDYIRYPLHDNKQNFDFSADALRQFSKATKLDARNLKSDAERQIWQDWKTKQVTETVESFNQIIRKTRPNWEISVAVFPGFEHTLKVKMQDSRTWAKNGWINAIYPMLYSMSFETVDTWASEFRREIPAAVKVNAAFYVSHFYDTKTGKVDARFLEIPSKYKYDGVAFFAAQLLTDDLIEQLGK